MPAFLDHARSRLFALWRLLREEHASPKEIGWAIGVGVFVGCTPALGFHGVVAISAAVALRLNKIWTWIGSRASNIFVLPWIVLAEIEIAHRLRVGVWLPLSVDDVLVRGPELLLDWILGTLPVGAVLGASFGAVAYLLARWRAERARPHAPPPTNPPDSA